MKRISFILICASMVLYAGESTDITTYHRTVFGPPEYNRHGVAHIVTEKEWVAINRKKQIIYIPFIFDNGPDYLREGLLRYRENGKIGFVNEAGKKVIKAQFDFVHYFENGRARFCNGCKYIQEGEHSLIDEKSGTWGEVDRRGRIFPDPKK